MTRELLEVPASSYPVWPSSSWLSLLASMPVGQLTNISTPCPETSGSPISFSLEAQGLIFFPYFLGFISSSSHMETASEAGDFEKDS